MKSKFAQLFLAFVPLCFLVGCTDETSVGNLDDKVNLLARAWYGEEFSTITLSDTSFRAKDMVAELSFASDGSYHFYKYTMSASTGQNGRWAFASGGDSLKLTRDTTYAETFSIRSLTLSNLVLGDTNSRGFALVPLHR
jgi:hypothetical protein